MSHKFSAFLLAISTLSATGCAEFKERLNDESRNEFRNDVPQIQNPSQAVSLLSYANNLRNRNTNELNSELETLNRAYTQHRTEENRLRLGIFHAMTPNGDRARALSLLDVAPSDTAKRGRNNPIAIILIPLLQEARRSDDGISTAQQRLRDEQKRSESLQQKLDAIREIEKKMVERVPGKTP